MDIIAIGYAGMSGTVKLIDYCHDRLLSRFTDSYIKKCRKIAADGMEVYSEAFLESEAYIEVGRGGCFAALWDISQLLNKGMVVNYSDIPIRQEIIQICNEMDVNPYELESKGMYLLAVNNGYRMCDSLKEKGIVATVIGYTTDNNDKIIKSGEITRYIEKNRGKEELERIINK